MSVTWGRILVGIAVVMCLLGVGVLEVLSERGQSRVLPEPPRVGDVRPEPWGEFGRVAAGRSWRAGRSEASYLGLTHRMRRQPLNRLTFAVMSGTRPTCFRSGSSGRFDFQPSRVHTGATRSSRRPTAGRSLRKWLSTTMFPPGFTTRFISRSTPTGSGTALMV